MRAGRTAAGILAFAIAGIANGAIINLSLGEYTSPVWTGVETTYNVGIFNFDLAGESVISASINGAWGNTFASSTAHNVLKLDGVQLADSQAHTPDPFSNPNVAWSYEFIDFSIFSDGVASFDVTQTSGSRVRLDDTYLTIETIPEPASAGLIVLMSSGIFWVRRFFVV